MTGVGLTLKQLMTVTSDLIPTDRLGDLLQRLPAKYYAPDLQLYRPITPAVLAALDLLEPCDEPCGCDERLAGLVELAAADPDGAPHAWTALPDGSPLYVGQLLGIVAQRLAALYAPRRSSKKPTAPVA